MKIMLDTNIVIDILEKREPFFANSYPVFCPGLSHGRALTFGTLVGRALAKDELINE